jgi:hypothetical protein
MYAVFSSEMVFLPGGTPCIRVIHAFFDNILSSNSGKLLICEASPGHDLLVEERFGERVFVTQLSMY